MFFLQRSGWSAVGEPLQKTPGTVAGKHRETVAKKQKTSQTTPVQVGKTQLPGNTLVKQSQKTTALATARTTALTIDSFGDLWGVESPYQGRATSEIWYL